MAAKDLGKLKLDVMIVVLFLYVSQSDGKGSWLLGLNWPAVVGTFCSDSKSLHY